MTTRECFVQYISMAEEVEKLERKARKAVTVSDTVKGSDSEHPYQKRTFAISGETSRENEKIKKRIRLLHERMAEVEEAIEDVDDSKLRPALEMKYLDGLTWRDIAQRLGGSEEAIRKRVRRYFQKNF